MSWEEVELTEEEKAQGWEEATNESDLPEVSQMEALGIGAGEGLMFGHSDEASGLMGAGLETLSATPQAPGFLGAPIEEVAEPVQVDIPEQSIIDVYKEYRDAARRRKAAAEAQHPGTTFAGEMAGGFLVPASMFKQASSIPKGLETARKAMKASQDKEKALRAAKRAMQLKKMMDAAKIGAKGGAIAGAGLSEAELTDVMDRPAVLGEFAADTAAGTALGGALGPAVVAGAGALKGMKRGYDATKKFIKDTESFQEMMSAYRRTLKGQNLVGRKGREEATQALHGWIKEYLPQLKTLKQDLNKNIEDAIQEAQERGETVDLEPILLDMKSRLTELTTAGDPELTKDATSLLKIVDNWLLGPESTKLVKTQTPQEKAIERVMKKRAQTRLATEAGEPLGTAEQRLLKKRAEIEARAPEDNIPEYEAPEIYTTDEGQRVLRQRGVPDEGALDPETAELIRKGEIDLTPEEALAGADEAGGISKTLTQIINDPNLTPVDVVTDEASGMRFLQYKDEGTGKIHQEFIPETDEFFKAYKPMKTRGEPKRQVTPEEARRFKQIMQARTPVKSPNIHPEVQTEALGAVNQIKDAMANINDNVNTAEQAYSNMMQALKIMKMDKNPTVTEALQKIGNEIGRLEQDTVTGHIHKEVFTEFINKLTLADADTAARIKNQMLDLAERMDLAFTRATPAVVAGKSGATIRTGVAGYPTLAGVAGGKAAEVSKRISERLIEADNQILLGMGQKLLQAQNKIKNMLGQEIMKMANKDKRTRQAIMFGIMQREEYRKQLQEISSDIQNPMGEE